MHALRGEIEAKEFDGDEAILLGLVGAEYRAESTRSDLMQDAEGPESVGWRSANGVRIQRGYSSKEGIGS